MPEKHWLVAVFALYFCFAVGYSLLMPPWEGPDEPAHYILAVNLARVGRFSSIERNYEAGQPQTYYRLASVPLKWLHQTNRDWVAVIYPERDYGNVRQAAPIFFWSDENYVFLPGLYALRWLNILMGAGALGLNYAAMRSFSLKKSLPSSVPLAALALAALTPQFLHTTSSVANDTLGILAGAFLFWLVAKIAQEDVHPVWLILAIVSAFLLPYGTKLTVLPVGLAGFIVVILKTRERWPRQWLWLAGAGAMMGIVLLLTLIFVLPETGRLFWNQVRLRAFYISEEAFSVEYIWKMVSQVAWSYWGLVGWLAVGLPGWLVVVLTGLGLSAVGAEGWKRRGDEEKRRQGGVEKWVVWLVGGVTVLAVLRNGLSTINSQGRFLFPAIGALALLMAGGWDKLLPARFRDYLLPGVIILMTGVNLILWFDGIIPVYYQPFWD